MVGAPAFLLVDSSRTQGLGRSGGHFPSWGTLGPGLTTSPGTGRAARAEKGEGPRAASVFASVPPSAGKDRQIAVGGSGCELPLARERTPDICQGVGAAVCAPKVDGKIHRAKEKGDTRGRKNKAGFTDGMAPPGQGSAPWRPKRLGLDQARGCGRQGLCSGRPRGEAKAVRSADRG